MFAASVALSPYTLPPPLTSAQTCFIYQSGTLFTTYDHRKLKTGHPVRSGVLKQFTGCVVVGWVTTSEFQLLYVDLSFVLLLFCFSAICFQPFDAWKRHLSSFWGHRSVAKRVTLLCGKGQESREASPSTLGTRVRESASIYSQSRSIFYIYTYHAIFHLSIFTRA